MSNDARSADLLDLTSRLIEQPSVSPADGECQAMMGEFLAQLGFTVEAMPFGDVSNFWAVLDSGRDGPLFAFAGHTDVVPPGPAADWQTDPFTPHLDGDTLYGRGAADMKGSLAAMLVAVRGFLADRTTFNGRIGFLITSDEEADAINGTVKVIEALEQRGEHIDCCLVGEPSSSSVVGDVIRVGRRGSLNATLTVRGIQGHVAYPQDARNPIHEAMAALAELAAESWDSGNAFFPPTSMQISNINGGTGATNVIPGELRVLFNFRFSTESTADDLKARAEAILTRHKLDYSVQWTLSGAPFLTRERDLIDAVTAAIRHHSGIDTDASTSGGTSDGRFIAPYGTQVVELGPCNATIHKVNECVSVQELTTLSYIYQDILGTLLGESGTTS